MLGDVVGVDADDVVIPVLLRIKYLKGSFGVSGGDDSVGDLALYDAVFYVCSYALYGFLNMFKFCYNCILCKTSMLCILFLKTVILLPYPILYSTL